MKIALRIKPQRNTQYANMADVLAAPEILASPVGARLDSLTPIHLAAQAYLLAEYSENTVELAEWAALLPRLGAISEGFEYFAQIANVDGPLLRPLEPSFTPFVPPEMAEVRRYKGKTNELFTQVLLNMAIFAGGYRDQFHGRLRILDPLAGGATTLFLALAAGYDAFGIEHNRQDVESTEVFVRQYLHSEHIPYKEVDEKVRKAGRRYQLEVGKKGETRSLVLAHGETAQAAQHMHEVVGGPHFHAIVGDLPYGIQHFGELVDILRQALPVWEQLLLPGGTLALAWNATRSERAALGQLIETQTRLRLRNDPPYTQLEHTVDRVIKKRDILIAVKARANRKVSGFLP